MPRGLKRNFNGDPTHEVGSKINRKKNQVANQNEFQTVAMIHDHDESKQNKTNCISNARRVSKRVIKAKRKLDFVYEGDVEDSTENSSGVNNNAQIVHDKISRSRLSKGQGRLKRKVAQVPKGKQQLIAKKRLSVLNNKPNDVFDGVQVSVNSDEEEELDYVDDVEDDENGSINQDNDRGTTGGGPTDKHECGEGGSIETDLGLGASSASLMDEQNEQMIMNNPHL